jgi:hypothetical protein
MNVHEMVINLRALELWNAHYAARPHITERDYSSITFYRCVAAAEAAGMQFDHEALRASMGGSFQ